MYKQRRDLRMLIYAMLLAVSTVVAISSPAQQPPDPKTTFHLRMVSALSPIRREHRSSGHRFSSVTFTAGDCRQMGANQGVSASVTLLPPPRAGTAIDRLSAVHGAGLPDLNTPPSPGRAWIRHVSQLDGGAGAPGVLRVTRSCPPAGWLRHGVPGEPVTA